MEPEQHRAQEQLEHLEVLVITVDLHTWKTDLVLSARTAPSPRLESELRALLTSEVYRLDALASRFRADSELSAVNAGSGQWVEVSWSFVAVLSACLDAARRSGGLVDPTLGTAIKAAGYDVWAEQTTPTAAAPHRGKWRGVGIRPGHSEAQVRIPAGSALDLGSVAKAWLADRLASAVARSGYEVCANMGGDIRVIADDPWTVWADPEVAGVPAVAINLTDAGLATSGTGHRRWASGHHLIDPRTGTPAQTPWRSVSVVAATATAANTAATAGVVLGENGPAWLSAQSLDARFTAATHTVTTHRWPQEVAA